MDVLVTGATGFVGGRLVARLVDRGDRVRALVRDTSHHLAALGVEQHVADLTDPDDLAGPLAGVDAVVHAAASLGSDLDEARRVNRDGTGVLVDALWAHSSPRLVHVSTTAVYDRDAAGDVEIGERSPLVSGGSPYAVTKVEAEAEVARGVGRGVSALVLRPPAVLGAGERSVWGAKVPRAVRDGSFPARHPSSTFAWVHVEDLVTAVLIGLTDGAEGTVNVVGGSPPISAYLEPVAAAVGVPPPLSEDAEPGWQGRLDDRRMVEVLGIRPTLGFDEAMHEIASWWAS
jgi:2-alkyl-3-oxoalkanoate reductase